MFCCFCFFIDFFYVNGITPGVTIRTHRCAENDSLAPSVAHDRLLKFINDQNGSFGAHWFSQRVQGWNLWSLKRNLCGSLVLTAGSRLIVDYWV